MTSHESRRLPWDWYNGVVPENVSIDPTAYVETAFSFYHHRSQAEVGVRIAKGASVYKGTMFDIGAEGRVTLGEYALVHGARVVCDEAINIGAYALISWNVVLMDTYRVPIAPLARRALLKRVPTLPGRWLTQAVGTRPITIGRNVWIGFDTCVLPGVTIGEGSIVGARSVVAADVPAYTIVAGSPARVIRQIEWDHQ